MRGGCKDNGKGMRMMALLALAQALVVRALDDVAIRLRKRVTVGVGTQVREEG
jgi:hypothetical protein